VRISKRTDPLARLFRTTEGVLLFAFNVAAIVLAVVDQISPEYAIKYAALFNGIAFASRQFLKMAAVLSPVTGPTPPVWQPLQAEVEGAPIATWLDPQPASAVGDDAGEPDVPALDADGLTDAEEFAGRR
jgi:hypothetical protein